MGWKRELGLRVPESERRLRTEEMVGAWAPQL